MSHRIRHGRAQFNYNPATTRPGGTGEVRSIDTRRPGGPKRPTRRDDPDGARPFTANPDAYRRDR